MSIDASNLEIFVLTCNRATYLRETLHSLDAQTVKGFRVVVLDNASTDNTPDIVASFASNKVELDRSPKNIGVIGNLMRAQKLASRVWVMVLHDDDLLHPRYVEAALIYTKKFPNVAMVGASMSFEDEPNQANWQSYGDEPRINYCSGDRSLATLLYAGFPLHFGSVIYRTAYFRIAIFEPEKYGKIADRPFLLSIASKGAVIVLRDSYVQYRCHAGQDSATSLNGPFVKELFALHRLYLNYMGDSPFTLSGRTFVVQNYRYLTDEYPRLMDHERQDMTRKVYIHLAIKEGASTLLAAWLGWFYMHTLGRVWIWIRNMYSLLQVFRSR